MSPTRKRISDGIQSIMSRLNLGINNASTSNDMNERMVSPWNIDDYCNNQSETALHTAVRQRHIEIATLLLAAGANPNLHMYPVDTVGRFGKSHISVCVMRVFSRLCDLQNMKLNSQPNNRTEATTALVVACENRDIPMTDLLLKYDARDDDSKALSVAIKLNDESLMTKMLSIKVS